MTNRPRARAIKSAAFLITAILAAPTVAAQLPCEQRPDVHFGMTEAEVRASKAGEPWNHHELVSPKGLMVEWIYPGRLDDCGPPAAGARSYVFFQNGRVVAVQE